MSKFYSNYCNNNQGKPDFLIEEEIRNEHHRMHIRQANITTRGKHTGSKSHNKIMYNIHRAVSVIQSLYSGYNA